MKKEEIESRKELQELMQIYHMKIIIAKKKQMMVEDDKNPSSDSCSLTVRKKKSISKEKK